MDLHQERAQAQERLAVAERAMVESSRDQAAFAETKRQHQGALDALERLEWAEKRERELAEQTAREQRLSDLREAQDRARMGQASYDEWRGWAAGPV
jgi:septal ring factor EnvC (AmiA/AmiB activator)